jgi:hypothetical protein
MGGDQPDRGAAACGYGVTTKEFFMCGKEQARPIFFWSESRRPERAGLRRSVVVGHWPMRAGISVIKARTIQLCETNWWSKLANVAAQKCYCGRVGPGAKSKTIFELKPSSLASYVLARTFLQIGRFD